MSFTSAAPAPTAQAASASTYVVKPGDSLNGIARKLGVAVDTLLQANGLSISSVILPGQQLQVPGVTAPAAGGGAYTVKPGDSLGGIARRHGVSLNALLSANGFTAASLIVPGQSIALPAGAVTQTAAAPAAAPAAAVGGSYTVKAGDSLARIAQRNGVGLEALLAANGFTATSLILPGQSIALPAGAVAQSAGAAVAGGSYTIQAGDSLSRIAQRYGVTLTALLSTNGFTTASLIVPGQSISLPAGAVAPAPSATPATPSAPANGGTYTIRPGDSLGGIAQRYGITLGSLLAANGFTAGSLILPGQTITLPAGAAPRPPPPAPRARRSTRSSATRSRSRASRTSSSPPAPMRSTAPASPRRPTPRSGSRSCTRACPRRDRGGRSTS